MAALPAPPPLRLYPYLFMDALPLGSGGWHACIYFFLQPPALSPSPSFSVFVYECTPLGGWGLACLHLFFAAPLPITVFLRIGFWMHSPHGLGAGMSAFAAPLPITVFLRIGFWMHSPHGLACLHLQRNHRVA